VRLLLVMGVLLAVLVGLGRTLDLANLETVLSQAQWGYFIPSTLINLITLGCIITRWYWLLNGQAPWWACLAANQIGAYLNTLLPLRLGDVARSYLIQRHVPHLSMLAILSSIGAELTFDMLILMILLAGLLAVLPLPSLLTSAGTLLAILTSIAVVGALTLGRNPQVIERWVKPLLGRLPSPMGHLALGIVERVQEGLSSLRDNRQTALLFGISVLGYLLQILSNWLLLMVFLDSPPLYMGLVALVGAGMGLALPLLPGSAGTYEVAVALALGAVGVAPEVAASYAILLRLQQLGMTVALGGFFLVREGVSLGDLRRVRVGDQAVS
jgi:uncharacterized protein (TIRG00374 family)